MSKTVAHTSPDGMEWMYPTCSTRPYAVDVRGKSDEDIARLALALPKPVLIDQGYIHVLSGADPLQYMAALEPN